MKITYYKSVKLEKTETEEVGTIYGTIEPEEMSEEEREEIRNGNAIPMCNFVTTSGTWKAIPWQFIIKIED